jgi:tRNA(Ile)-lysidine synthase
MLARIKEIIERQQLLLPNETIVVGVSGGVDSTALLHILCRLNQQYQYNWVLHAVHLNHGFRGEESDGDERYVESLCQALGVRCHLFARDVSLYMEETRQGAQEASREVRYQLYERVAKQVGAAKVALAHHADDQVETILFRILRGTGIHGLAGMPVRRWLVDGQIEVVRPFLSIYRSELEEYCQTHGLEPREDSSNRSRKYKRNKLRLDVLPQFEAINHRYREHLLQLAEAARIDDQCLNRLSRDYLEEVIETRLENKIVIARKKLQTCDLALQRRMITLILSYLSRKIEWSAQHVEAVLHVADGENPSAVLHLPKQVVVRRVYDAIRFEKETGPKQHTAYCYDIEVPGITWLSEQGINIRTAVADAPFDWKSMSLYTAVFDVERLPSGTLAVRNRRPGDRMSLLGLTGTKKLKDLMIDAKVPKALRERWPILVSDSQILWVPGVKRSDVAAVTQRTRKYLFVQVEYGEDWWEVPGNGQ